MNKTTTTLLTAAGLIFLAGCKTEVMGDRRYKDVPQEDPVAQQPMQRPVEKESAPAPVQKAPRFKPMNGEFSNEGVEDAAPAKKAKKVAAPACIAAKGGVYVVKRGDTLGRIARNHGVSVNALREANNRTAAQDRFLRPGTKLVIPGGKAVKAVKAGKGAKAAAPAKVTGKLNADGTYTIVKGDNIPKIARKFGIRAKALQAANNLSDEATTRLQIGQKLVIPTGADARYTAGKKKAAQKPAPKAAPKQAPVPAADEVAPVTPPPAEQPAAAPVAAPEATAPAAPAAAPAADGDTAAVLPPAADTASAAGTEFVSVAGYKDLAEFAAKNNTTIDELCKLNPRLNPAEPLAVNDMLYVPKK